MRVLGYKLDDKGEGKSSDKNLEGTKKEGICCPSWYDKKSTQGFEIMYINLVWGWWKTLKLLGKSQHGSVRSNPQWAC
jgi:hypothetical protein